MFVTCRSALPSSSTNWRWTTALCVRCTSAVTGCGWPSCIPTVGAAAVTRAVTSRARPWSESRAIVSGATSGQSEQAWPSVWARSAFHTSWQRRCSRYDLSSSIRSSYSTSVCRMISSHAWQGRRRPLPPHVLIGSFAGSRPSAKRSRTHSARFATDAPSLYEPRGR